MAVSPLIQGAALSLISVGLGYWAGFLQKWRDERRRRRAVATALLTELRWLERMLRQLAVHPEAAHSSLGINMEVHDRFLPDLLLFPVETARALLDLRALVREVVTTRENIRSGRVTAKSETHRMLSSLAAHGARLIPELKRLLEAAGGEAPPELNVSRSGHADQLELPPPAFPDLPAE